MKRRGLMPGVWTLALLLVCAGCATSKIDWNARVGNYTYDHAVQELGPPDRSARLTDGTTVAEWLVYRGSRGYSDFWYGPYYAFPIYEPPAPDRFVRLTFTPDGILKAWRRVLR